MLKGSRDGMAHIKNMELADNLLTNITFIAEHFPNLQRLQLSRNRIESIEGVAASPTSPSSTCAITASLRSPTKSPPP
jgi:Leucine-rich repeat (LRR) protein